LKSHHASHIDVRTLARLVPEMRAGERALRSR
jgi:hypothetical protein